jgi:hypothetical protein
VATGVATDEATRVVTREATRVATDEATRVATREATDLRSSSEHFRASLRGVVRVVGDSLFVRNCIERSWYMRNGGNHWASWCCYLSFVRDIVGFKCPEHEPYSHYETCAIRSGWRLMHPKFVIVSDRPKIHKTEIENGRHRLHCEDGPSMQWRDGWALWHIHGVAVCEQIVLRPETQTVEQIDREPNNDVRAIRLQRFGIPRYLMETGAEVLDECRNDIENTHEALLRAKNGNVFMWPTCPSGRLCPPLPVPNSIKTCEQARKWLAGERPFRVLART